MKEFEDRCMFEQKNPLSLPKALFREDNEGDIDKLDDLFLSGGDFFGPVIEKRYHPDSGYRVSIAEMRSVGFCAVRAVDEVSEEEGSVTFRMLVPQSQICKN